MARWKSTGRRDLWLPVLVAIVGVLGSIAIWGLLVEERQDALRASARETASETQHTIENALRDQVAAVTGLGNLWQEFGVPPSGDEWRAHVDPWVDHVPGLVSLTWEALDRPVRQVATGTQGLRGEADESDVDADVEADALRIARDEAGAPVLEGPVTDPAGGSGYRIVMPVRTPDERRGVLIAHFDVRAFLEHVLRARAPGYALDVEWSGTTIFSRGEPSVDGDPSRQSVARSIALPLDGAVWTMSQRPTEELLVGRGNPALQYLLSAGILLSLVLAVLAHQLRVIVRQSRFLEASNRALEKRGAELESKVDERTEALQDAVTELEAFNYSVSHDLRSPLGAILNFTTILEEDHRDRPLDQAGIALLERIRRSANRALALLEDLLNLSRAGRSALDFETIDMAALARETFAQVRIAEGDDEIEFIVEPLPEVVGDRTLLGDVFANLFSNALKYSRGCEKRCIRVAAHENPGDDEFVGFPELESERGASGRPEVVYEVGDNGHGFDMRFADKLFQLFERLHSDDEIEGTGVGLAMVARIVKRHGGHVWADSRPGEGARFSFSLPRREQT